MFDILINGIGNYKIFNLDYCEEEVFKEYGKFLDSVPDKNKKEVAEKILKFLDKYNRDMMNYTKHDEINEERENYNLPPLERKKNEAYNKIKKDLILAEKFRESLESFKEMEKRKERITAFDNYPNPNLTPVDIKISDSIIQYNEMKNFQLIRSLETSKEKQEKSILELSDPYYRMVTLVDEYIDDLTNYWLFREKLKMAKYEKYLDSYTKPSRAKLKEYLISVCSAFELKNCVNNVKKLIIELNKKC